MTLLRPKPCLSSNCCEDLCVSDNYVRQRAKWPIATGWYAGLLVPGTSRFHNNLDSYVILVNPFLIPR